MTGKPMSTVTGSKKSVLTAMILSYLGHPLFMPILAVLLLLYGGTYLSFLPATFKHFDLTLVFLNTILIPLAYMHIFRRMEIISSYHLEIRRERVIPLALYTLLLLVTWFILHRVRQPAILTDLFLALTVTAAITFLITLRRKISLHLSGLGSLSALLLAASLRLTSTFILLWLLSLVLAGAVASARLILRQHTPAEVYAGFFVAFTTTFLVLFF